MEGSAAEFFRCEDCTKSFAKRSGYNRHRKTHDRPHPCSLCRKAFALKADLHRHRITHQETTLKFPCRYPGCKFRGASRKDYLWAHIKQSHQPLKDSSGTKSLRDIYEDSKNGQRHSTNAEKNLLLLESVSLGDGNQIQELLNAGADIRSKYSRSESVLQIALRKGHTKVIEILITAAKKEWSPQETLDSLQSLLHESINAGNRFFVETFIAHGANPEMLSPWNSKSQTALHTSADSGQVEMTRLLLDRGIGDDKTSTNDETALCIAIRTNNISIAQLILNHATDDQVGSSYGVRALVTAITCKNDQMVESLLKCGVAVNYPEEERKLGRIEPLHQAVITAQVHVVEVLLQKGAHASKRWRSRTPLHQVIQKTTSSPKMTQLLVDAGADVHILDGYPGGLRRHPLQYLCWLVRIRYYEWNPARIAIARILLDAGAQLGPSETHLLPDELRPAPIELPSLEDVCSRADTRR